MTREEIAIRLAKDPEFKKLAPDRQQAVFEDAYSKSNAASISQLAAPITSPQVNPIVKQLFTPGNPDQALAETEAGISSRPSSIQSLIQFARNPQSIQQHPFKAALSVPGAALEAGESIPANIGLAAQRGELQPNLATTLLGPGAYLAQGRLPGQLLQGVTGQRPAEVGDIARASGLPAFKIAAPAIGAGAMAGPLKGFAKPSESVIGIPEQIGKFIGKPLKPAMARILDPASSFAYNKTLEIRKGLTKYFRDLNTKYGDDIDKLSKDMGGVMPTNDIIGSLRLRLQEAGLLDFYGNRVQRPISNLSSTEQKLLTLHDELSTNPNIGQTIPFQDVMRELRQLRQNIRSAVKSGNQSINQDERIVYGVLHDVSNKASANNQSLLKINSDYAKERQFLDDANQRFQIWKGEYNTGRGEATLGSFYDKNEGTRRMLQAIEDKTGIKLVRGSRALSAYRQLTERHLIGAGIGGTIGYQMGGPIGGGVGTAVGSGAALALGRLAKNAIPSYSEIPPAIKAIVMRHIDKQLKSESNANRN